MDPHDDQEFTRKLRCLTAAFAASLGIWGVAVWLFWKWVLS